MAKIEFKDVSFEYGDKQGEGYSALENVNFAIEEGEFVSIIGSSGCGKSTILSILAGLHAPQSGSVLIDGVETRGCGKNRGVVFQHYSLFPWMTIKGNIEFGIKQNYPSMSKKDRLDRAYQYLESVGLKGFESKYPAELSGGMQQRAAIARMLAMDPDIFLMDEPFGAIDAKNRVILQDLLLEILDRTKEKKTIVFVTHDVDEAILLSDRILYVRNKKVAQEIKVPLARPRNRDRLSIDPKYASTRKKIIDMFYYEEEQSDFQGGEGI